MNTLTLEKEGVKKVANSKKAEQSPKIENPKQEEKPKETLTRCRRL